VRTRFGLEEGIMELFHAFGDQDPPGVVSAISVSLRGGRAYALALVVLSGLMGAGCSSDYQLAPVSGTVTVDGKPLENVAVSFVPDTSQATPGPGSSGVTDAQGRFTLKTVAGDRDRGALVGKHRVRLHYSPPVPDGLSYEQQVAASAKAGHVLPPRARDGSLTFEVPPQGTSEANFAFASSSP